jgi:tryptophan halogenase
MEIPGSLAHRIRLVRGPNELCAENPWIQVILGQGIVPEQHHPVANVVS